MDGLTSGERKHRLAMGLPPVRHTRLYVYVRLALRAWHG